MEDPITNFYNEIVGIPRQDSLSSVESIGWDRIDCPHEWNNLYEWHDSNTWDNNDFRVPSTLDAIISVPENKNVIIRKCSLSCNASNYYHKIYVPSNSSLIFDDSDIDIHFAEIWIDGNLYVGNENCRLYSNINFYFHGLKNSSFLDVAASFDSSINSLASKAIVVNGNIQIHGKQFAPTWTKLAISAYAGDDRIYLQESVNWEVGQSIVIVTSVFQDYKDEHENEVKTIVAIGDSDWLTNNVIYFGDQNDDSLRYDLFFFCE